MLIEEVLARLGFRRAEERFYCWWRGTVRRGRDEHEVAVFTSQSYWPNSKERTPMLAVALVDGSALLTAGMGLDDLGRIDEIIGAWVLREPVCRDGFEVGGLALATEQEVFIVGALLLSEVPVLRTLAQATAWVTSTLSSATEACLEEVAQFRSYGPKMRAGHFVARACVVRSQPEPQFCRHRW